MPHTSCFCLTCLPCLPYSDPCLIIYYWDLILASCITLGHSFHFLTCVIIMKCACLLSLFIPNTTHAIHSYHMPAHTSLVTLLHSVPLCPCFSLCVYSAPSLCATVSLCVPTQLLHSVPLCPYVSLLRCFTLCHCATVSLCSTASLCAGHLLPGPSICISSSPHLGL
jgi:hypothetical protein